MGDADGEGEVDGMDGMDRVGEAGAGGVVERVGLSPGGEVGGSAAMVGFKGMEVEVEY